MTPEETTSNAMARQDGIARYTGAETRALENYLLGSQGRTLASYARIENKAAGLSARPVIRMSTAKPRVEVPLTQSARDVLAVIGKEPMHISEIRRAVPHVAPATATAYVSQLWRAGRIYASPGKQNRRYSIEPISREYTKTTHAAVRALNLSEWTRTEAIHARWKIAYSTTAGRLRDARKDGVIESRQVGKSFEWRAVK